MNLKRIFLSLIFSIPGLLTLGACSSKTASSPADDSSLYLNASDVTGVAGPFSGTWTANSCSLVKDGTQSKYCWGTVTVLESSVAATASTPAYTSLTVSASVNSTLDDTHGAPDFIESDPVVLQGNGIYNVKSFTLPVSTQPIGKVGMNAFLFNTDGTRVVFKLLGSGQARIIFYGLGKNGDGTLRAPLTLK